MHSLNVVSRSSTSARPLAAQQQRQPGRALGGARRAAASKAPLPLLPLRLLCCGPAARTRFVAIPAAAGSDAAAATATTTAAAPAEQQQQQQQQQHALRVPDWPHGVHTVRMEVRDTELDQFQVVNNNMYGVYMQHGRHKALESMGAGVGDYQRRGTLMALSDLVLKFKAPLRSGDVFRVETSVEQVTAARLVMRQTVVREAAPAGGGGNGNGGGGSSSSSGNGSGAKAEGEAVCAEALATVVFLDPHYRPVRLPAGDRAVFEALRQRAAAAAAGGGGD